MSPPTDPDRRQHRAEAATWLARLRSDARSPDDEAAFEAWASADPRRRTAFQEVTEAFEIAGAHPVRERRRQRQMESRLTRRRILQGAGIAAGAAGIGFVWMRPDATYATAVGERRRLVLEDRTVVEMDTDTRLSVRFDAGRRNVTLARGRAAFAVATDQERPFCVYAADRRVVATGGRFDVARLDKEVTVLAEQGVIGVGEAGLVRRGALEPLAPGARGHYAAGGTQVETVSDVSAATAWRDGRLQFDGETLATAVGQMNRYSRTPLVILDPGLAAQPIAGVYQTGDSRAFAESVALLVDARVRVEPSRIILERVG